MRIGERITLFTGAASEKRKTLFAGNLNQGDTVQDRIAQKKAQAQKQAMKVVGDAWEKRQSIDDDLENRRVHIKELQEEKKVLQQEAEGVASRQDVLERAYEAGEVSQAEYMSEKLNLFQEEKAYRKKISDNENGVMSENAVIRGAKREMPKDQSMVKARKQSDAILGAAEEEIAGMVMEDAKEKAEEKSEEREEQADKIKEERQEQKEYTEIPSDVPVEEMLSLDRTKDDVEQEIQNILDKMKLLSEDMKGAAVDETL